MDEDIDLLFERVRELEERLDRLAHHRHVQSATYYATGKPLYIEGD